MKDTDTSVGMNISDYSQNVSNASSQIVMSSYKARGGFFLCRLYSEMGIVRLKFQRVCNRRLKFLM